jgi:hypothetical protein
MTDVFGISDISQGGPGAPPQPWIVGNNAIAYNGAVLVPSQVLGGSVTPPGTINTNDLYIKGVPIEQLVSSNYLPLTGGSLTGPLHISGLINFLIGDGSAGQMISSNGDGTLSWRNIVGVGLPAGGTNGQVLATDGNVNFYWTSLLPGGPYIPVSSGPFLPIVGGTLTGNLNISKAAGNARDIIGQTAGSNRWILRLGGNAAESGSNAGSDFALVPYSDAGAALANAITITRATGATLFNGPVTLAAANSALYINGAALTGRNIFGQTAGVSRWAIQLGGGGAESGSNAGSDFAIYRYNDAGVNIDTPLTIVRSTGAATFSGAGRFNGSLSVGAAMAAMSQLSLTEVATNSNAIVGFFNGATRMGYVGLVTENIMLTKDSIGYYIQISNSGIVLNSGGSANGVTLSAGVTIVYNLQVNGSVNINSSLGVAGTGGINATAGPVQARNGMYIYSTGGDVYLYCCDSGGSGRGYHGWQASNGNCLMYNAIGGGQCYMDQSNQFVTSAANAYKVGGGAWAASSDIRIKNVQGEYKSGLQEIIKLKPVIFTYKGNDTQNADVDDTPLASIEGFVKTQSIEAPYPASIHYNDAIKGTLFTGLVADDVIKVLPEMVSFARKFIDGEEVDDFKHLDTSNLAYAFINAIKELNARLSAIEAKLN